MSTLRMMLMVLVSAMITSGLSQGEIVSCLSCARAVARPVHLAVGLNESIMILLFSMPSLGSASAADSCPIPSPPVGG